MLGSLRRTLAMQYQMRGDYLFFAACGMLLTTDHLFFNRCRHRLIHAGVWHYGPAIAKETLVN
jgi:hypothetical protein